MFANSTGARQLGSSGTWRFGNRAPQKVPQEQATISHKQLASQLGDSLASRFNFAVVAFSAAKKITNKNL